MEKQILLHSQFVNYTLKTNHRARRLRIIVHSDGSLVVTIPRWMNPLFVEQFLCQKSDWILEKLAYAKTHPVSVAVKHTKQEIDAFKKETRKRVEERLQYFNALYDCKWNTISVRNQTSRWGSCSKKGNLNFNYRLALLPEYLTDYVVVHELCHLKEFNHSKRFWDLVAKAMPDHKERRKELKKHRLG